MQLPTEDDWKPRLSNKEISDNEYEDHVKLLAKRLHEANKMAGQQSKLSNETTNGYYDRHTKLELFNL
jgi:hypothetical protein